MITWVLIAIMCGAIGYSARILMDYVAFEHDVLPAIDRLEDRAQKLLAEVDWEAEQKDRLRDQVQGLQESVEELQGRAAKARAELQAERTLHRRLEMEVNRHQLKQRRKVTTG